MDPQQRGAWTGGQPQKRRGWLVGLALLSILGIGAWGVFSLLGPKPMGPPTASIQGSINLDGSKLTIDGLSGELDLGPLIEDLIKEELKENPPTTTKIYKTTKVTQNITGGSDGVDTDTDDQTLSLLGNVLTISEGNSVDLPEAPAEEDGIIGNELADVTDDAGLVRVGAGTTADPYKVGLISCANNEVLKSSGAGVWACGTDAGGTSYTADGQGIELIGSEFSLELNGASLSKGASGLTLNLSNANTWAALQTFGAGATVTVGQALTVNGDAFTDLTGTGLTISGGALQTSLGTSIDLTTEVTGVLPLANGGTGTSTVFTEGSLVFAGASGLYTQDNAALFWDNATNRLGIGNNSPDYALDVTGDTNTSGVYRIAGTQICGATGCNASSTSAILNGTSQQTANFNIVSAGTGSIGAIIQGASGQSADLFRVNDGAGATQFKINAAGTLVATVKPTAGGSTGALELGALDAQSSNDINGVIGFWGSGVKHAQIAYAVGDGFYLCNATSSPSGDYGQCSDRINLYGANAHFNGTGTFQNTANSTSAFRVLNDVGTAVLRVDSTNQRVAIGNVAPVFKFEVQDGDAAIYNSGNNTRLILGDSGISGQYGYFQWDSTNDYMRIERDGSNGLKISDNFVTIGNVFPDQPLKVANGTTLLTQINTTGSVQHKTTTNSATGFQVLNATDVPAFVIDTTTNAVKIGGGDVSPGATPGLLVLDHKNTSGDPTGTNGGMYYNSDSGKFRCYEGSVWKNCLGMAQDITFNATSGAGSTSDWDDVPNATVAEMFFNNPSVANPASRIKYDLTEAVQARFQFNVELVAGAATNTEARVQYSTDQSSWAYLDGGTGPAVNITTNGIHVSGWVNIDAGAKGDVFLRVIGTLGDGATDYDVGVVNLQVR